MKPKIVLLVLLLVFFLTNGESQTNKNQVETKQLTFEEISDDFSILKGALTTDYPSANRYISTDSVNKFWNKWERRLKSMNEREFFKLIGEITHSFHDEHLIPNISQDFFKNPKRRFLPFTIERQNNILRVAHVHSSANSLKAGDEILSINRHDTDEIIDEIGRRMHHDGHIKTFIERHFEDFSPTQSFNYFDMWYALLYEDRADYFELMVKHQADTIAIQVNSLARKDYLDFYWSRMPRDAPAKFRMIQDGVGYLEISSFHEWYRNQHKQNFRRFFERTFKTIDEKGIGTLILDLRRCEGGDDSNKLLLQYLIDRPFTVYRDMFVTFSGKPLYTDYYDYPSLELDSGLLTKLSENWYATSELGRQKINGLTEMEPKKQVFQGKLIVLISGATGSAAAVVAAMLKTYTDAIFIGEETGGTINGPTALIVPYLTLPNSQIRVEVPLVQMHLNVENPNGRGVVPDVGPLKKVLSNEDFLELITLIP
ncbi:MAG: S41 family peptidase [Croceivirga sp.]